MRWERGLRSIAGIDSHLQELEELWSRLCWMSDEKRLLAEMMGLLEMRRKAATTGDELRDQLQAAEAALEIYWRGFMKTAAEVLAQTSSAHATAEDRIAMQLGLAESVRDASPPPSVAAPASHAAGYTSQQDDLCGGYRQPPKRKRKRIYGASLHVFRNLRI